MGSRIEVDRPITLSVARNLNIIPKFRMKNNTEVNFSLLSNHLSEKCKGFISNKDEKYKLLCLVDDIILVWCKEDSNLLAQILLNVNSKANDGTETQTNSNKFQILGLSKTPYWDVKCLIPNKSGTGILLVGNEGVAVVELPKRWGDPLLFEGGSKTAICRVEFVGEQFLMCNPLVKIITADWHPGSVDHSFITVLSSDNYLRVYNLSYLDVPEQAIAVAKSSMISKESRKFGVGENAIDFGVGSPIFSGSEQEASSTFLMDSSYINQYDEEMEKQKNKYQELLWPIFILYNNGDVYYTVMSLNKKSLKRKTLYGPLSFLPSSFDNYGIDFCCLHVLPTSPIVLVIANTKGLLHHCIVMDMPRMDESEHIEDLSLSVGELRLEASSIYLHVYESVQISQNCSTSTSQFLILSEPSTPARYLVSHSEGLHCVSLPFVERLLPVDVHFPEYDLECQVEHLLSTRSFGHDRSCFLIGSCVSTSGKIYFLLNSGDIQTLSLSSILMPKLPLFRLQNFDNENVQSLKAYKESFEELIQSILRRTSSQPLLVSGPGGESDPEEYLNLFNKVTSNLRENYLKQQIKAREEIKRRHKTLCGQRAHLRNELTNLEREKVNLTEKAHEIAEKYEETNDKHLQIMRRLEVVIGNLVRRMPTMSSNEKSMVRELEDMQEKRKALQAQMDQLHAKCEWQLSQINKEKQIETFRNKKTSVLSENQLACLRVSLTKESEKLSTIVKKLNHVKKEVGV